MNAEYSRTWRDGPFLTPPPNNKAEASDYLSHHSAPSKLASKSTLPVSPPTNNDLYQHPLGPHTLLTPEVMHQHILYQTEMHQNPLYLPKLQQDFAAELSVAMESLNIAMPSYDHTNTSEGQIGALPMTRFETTLKESYHQVACYTFPTAAYMEVTHQQNLLYQPQTSCQAQHSSHHGHPFEDGTGDDLDWGRYVLSRSDSFPADNARLREEFLNGVGTNFEALVTQHRRRDAVLEELCEQFAAAPLTYNTETN